MFSCRCARYDIYDLVWGFRKLWCYRWFSSWNSLQLFLLLFTPLLPADRPARASLTYALHPSTHLSHPTALYPIRPEVCADKTHSLSSTSSSSSSAGGLNWTQEHFQDTSDLEHRLTQCPLTSQQDEAPWHEATVVQERFEEHNNQKVYFFFFSGYVLQSANVSSWTCPACIDFFHWLHQQSWWACESEQIHLLIWWYSRSATYWAEDVFCAYVYCWTSLGRRAEEKRCTHSAAWWTENLSSVCVCVFLCFVCRRERGSSPCWHEPAATTECLSGPVSEEPLTCWREFRVHLYVQLLATLSVCVYFLYWWSKIVL